ncbi:hypothetical protein KC338_g4140 [Hortaea werneckii]|nr:hypothetical protein KC338_g4140 [Hortaea werneckii]KAI6868528.1 hypothetical protein KC323_g3086 [Hortaea werneckii]KAI7353179.1 hypothetical protein KC320_g4058 [Hortaea werneckii]
MEASPFARLPAELRNRIWTYALSQPDGFFLGLRDGQYELSGKDHQIALIETCRQINAETTLLLYNVNKFTFSASTNGIAHIFLPHVKDWLCNVGPTKASFIAEICFDLGQLPELPWKNPYSKSLRQVFDLVPDALSTVPGLRKSLAALTANVHGILNLGHVEVFTLELSLNKAEAIRQVKDFFDAKLDVAIKEANFDKVGYDEEPNAMTQTAITKFIEDAADMQEQKGWLLLILGMP